MSWMWNKKDGGPESRVHMYGYENKRRFSVLLLRFGHGSREAYHSHAFNCVSKILKGALYEDLCRDSRAPGGPRTQFFGRLLQPRTGWFKTLREDMHKVSGLDPATWVLTLRGPWAETWREYTHRRGFVTLTHGRKEVP